MPKRDIPFIIFLSLIVLFFGIIACSEAINMVSIYCPRCAKHLYDLKYEDKLDLSDLKVDNTIVIDKTFKLVNNSRFICPFDSAPLNGWEYWAWDRGLHEPTMAYGALSVYTKNDKGEFYWFPNDVNISDK